MANPVATCTYPGVEIGFYEKPWRAYTVNGDFTHPWTPDEPYGRVASVTQILGVLDKSGPLVGWAVNLTVEGIWTLVNRDDFRPPSHWRTLQRELADAGLDHRSATKAAQLRGTDVHKIGEDWVREGVFPKPGEYPDEIAGYVQAIGKFLMRHGDGLRVAEQMVGSLVHGFAGTCDTVAVATFGESTVRLDWKTSKQTYARTHFRQLAAYEIAAVECGEDPTDRQAIVVLGPDGDYQMSFVDEVEWATSPQQSFLDVLKVWRDEQPLKAHEDAEYKARRARERAA